MRDPCRRTIKPARRRTRANLTLAPFFQDNFFFARVHAVLLPCEWVGGTSLIRALLNLLLRSSVLNIHSCESCQSSTSSANSRRQNRHGSCISKTFKRAYWGRAPPGCSTGLSKKIMQVCEKVPHCHSFLMHSDIVSFSDSAQGCT